MYQRARIYVCVTVIWTYSRWVGASPGPFRFIGFTAGSPSQSTWCEEQSTTRCALKDFASMSCIENPWKLTLLWIILLIPWPLPNYNKQREIINLRSDIFRKWKHFCLCNVCTFELSQSWPDANLMCLTLHMPMVWPDTMLPNDMADVAELEPQHCAHIYTKSSASSVSQDLVFFENRRYIWLWSKWHRSAKKTGRCHLKVMQSPFNAFITHAF